MLPEPSMDHTTARKLAAAALRWIGPEARDAVPDLIVALNDDDESVQNNALAALSSIGGESELLVPLFIPFLEHPQFMTRQNACSALGKFGTNASAAIPTLRAVATNDAYESVRERAAGALRMIDPKYSSE